MGAGGAGKALAFGGKEKGARVVVANRTYGENLQSCSTFVVFLGSDNYLMDFQKHKCHVRYLSWKC